MKTRAIAAFIIAGSLSFTACTNKIDEKTMSEITQFGTEWTALGEQAGSWSQQLSETAMQATEFSAKQAEMVNSTANIKDEAIKNQIAEISKVSSEDASKLNNMLSEYSTFKTTWDETTQQFNEWQAKVSKGEINPQDAIKGLADFKTQMSDAQARFESWNTAYAETKNSCDKNMAFADELAKTIEPTAKK
jgi:chromosome segregation ATPase